MPRPYACIALSVLFFAKEATPAESFLTANEQFGRIPNTRDVAFIAPELRRQYTRISQLYVSMYDPRQVPKQSFYSILGVSPAATLDEIKRSYRRLVKLYHPGRFNYILAWSHVRSLLTQKSTLLVRFAPRKRHNGFVLRAEQSLRSAH